MIGASRSKAIKIGVSSAHGHLSDAVRRLNSGPARTRTEDQGIHSTPPFPARVDYLFTPVGCGTLVPVIKRNYSAQVVSAPSGGAPPAWLRIASGHRSCFEAGEVSLNSSRPLHTLRCEGTILLMSPLL